MTRSTEITVVTPTVLGREQSLAECQESVRSQTQPVREHLVGLDAERSGPSATRNRLVAEIDTPFILFLDDDDLLDPDYVEHVLPFLESNDVVYSWCRKNFDYYLDFDFDPDGLRRNNYIPITAVVRTDLFRAVGGFDPSPYEDWKLWIKFLDRNARFYCTKERKWEYRRSDDGQWSKDFRG